MKRLKTLLLFTAILTLAALALPLVAGAAALINDSFADGNSQNQNLATNSLRVFNGRSTTTRADAVGSVTFDMAATGSNSEGFWAFFTNSGSPVNLGVGDTLSVSGTFSLTGFVGTGQDIRFGVLNSLGTRNANNLTGGMNDATFSGDPGYALGYGASGSGAPFTIYRRTNLNVNNVFNTFADFTAIPGTGATARQSLTNNTPYTLTYTIERLSATETKITVSVTGAGLNNLNYTATESSATPNTAFDYFAFRVAGNTFAQKIQFTNLKVDYTPSLPVITSQPQPSNLVVQVGSSVTMSVGASGNSLSYQWRKDGAPISGNASASTPTLNLTNLQLADAGSYTAVVSNPGGSVTSSPVTLGVSTDPVPPPPSILTQPADTNAPLGSPASLSVVATGNNLFYQWFKNGTIIQGATGAALNFASAQPTDSANYTVVVSNSSGSITSAPAKLLVVSTMAATSFAPANGAGEINIDAPLYVTFNQAPKVGNTGRLRIFKEDGTLIDTIDMSAGSQSRLNGTVSFNYYPIIVTGNTAAIYPHQKLAYGQTYYVTMEPGVITDAAGAPFVGVSDPNLWSFSTKTSGPVAGTLALTVASDGTGDFNTVQGAVDFVPASNTKRVVITVRKGTYTEIVYIGSNKPFITVRGEDRALSVIQYANNNNFNPTSTTTRGLFGVDAADFTLENITLRNTTPQGGSQAEAFRGNNNRIVLNRVNLYSFQDTLLLQSQSNQGGFVTDSYIEGDVDFVWGAGAVFFQNTELKMVRPSAFYTQIRNGVGKNGNVFVNCRLTRSGTTVTDDYLTRIDPDDFPYSQVVFINTTMDVHIRPDPWRFDNPTNAVTAANYPNIRFWEYNSKDLNGAPVNVSQRHPISRQLTAAEAAQWSDPSFVLGGWAPQTKLTAAISLGNLNQPYNGSPIIPTVVTEPAGLGVSVTYNGSPVPPTAIGSYAVVATIQDATYQGTATGTLVIDRTPVAVTLSNLSQVADGTPKAVTVTTAPVGPVVEVTYNGSTTPPSAAGTYSVLATINDPNFKGGTSATLTIYAPGTQPLKAFPGAEGSGERSRGGRGGDVYHVTNLNDSGAGSLREGIRTASGPRTIVFDVSGTIYLNSRLSISKSFLTLAGQTAPGEGITIAGWPTVISNANNVIVRYMRFRVGDINCPAVQDDAFWVDRSTDVIVDHVSASWSVDETLSVTESDRVTVQWSMITESMRNSCHEKGAHGYGSLIRYGSGLITYHHNLYSHHDSRNPRVGDNIGLDFVNNVIYDWGIKAGYSGAIEEGTTRVNYVGNYLVAGPNTPTGNRTKAFEGGSVNTQIYQSNNMVDSNLNGARDGADLDWAAIIGAFTKRQPGRFEFAQVQTDAAATAYERVLTTAGHSLSRDAVDTRIVAEVRSEGGRHINSQNDVGGWPTLNSTAAPLDTDGDGIPDEWESNHGLNMADPNDGRAITSSGYSNLERYLNDIVPVSGVDTTHDSVAPASLATLSQEPNAAGWNNSDVTVTITATDEGGAGLHEIIYSVNGTTHHEHSALALIPVTGEGVTTITYYAKDDAGNTEALQTLTVKLDKTAPVIGDVSRTPANANGWNNTDVTANYQATDALSGFESGSTFNGTQTFNTEGENQSYNIELTDLAGNTAHKTISGISIDKTAPVIDATRTAANANGWNNTDVTASYSASDGLSGLASGSPATGAHIFTSEGAGQSYTFEVSDLAGNSASALVGDVNIDKSAPVINAARMTPANANGWNNMDVIVNYSASDTLSGLASPASGEHTFTNEGADQSQTFEVSDLAGNSASATVGGVNIDKTVPVISIAQPVEGAFYFINQPTQASYNCSDNLSGADCVGPVAANSQFDTASLGGKTFTVNSTDKAGNTAAKSVNYTVGYNLNLLYDPNKVNKSGSTIPIKLLIVDNAGANLSSAGTVVHALGVSLITTDTYGPVDAPGNSNPDLNFHFDPTLGGTGGYSFNLKTSGYASGTYRLYFTVGSDPYVYTTQFQIR
ncbi:MAG TPA: pectinesterase family protein [Pyrinomonadaceae bacterium]|jgi:pectin methylesterase-like acyl-CoA thioesterase